MRRILLTGAAGQVGWELQRTLAPLGEVIACTRDNLDLSDADSLRQTVRRLDPAIIVNAAAYTAVDRAEQEEPLAASINGDAPGMLAEEAARCGAWLVHYSTDYVFDGTKAAAYGEADAPSPVNAYGRSKLAGERSVAAAAERFLIFRTSWVYASRGGNFLRTICRLATQREELRVVDDQRGAPTWARLIAEATALALQRAVGRNARPDALSGIYHMTAGGAASWCDFARAILERQALARPPRLIPIPASEYPTPARRPQNSILSNAKLAATFGIALPCWKSGLALCLDDMRPQ